MCFVMPVADRRGGAENMLWLALVHHDRKALSVEVIFLKHGPFVDEVRGLGIPTRVVDAGRMRDIHKGVYAILRLTRLFRARRPDLCVSWMSMAHYYVGPACLMTRCRTVWWLHTIPAGSKFDRVAQIVPAAAIGSSSAVAIAELAKLSPQRPTFVVHPGVEDRGNELVADAGRRIRRELGISEDSIVVVLAGRFQRQKGHHRLVEAVQLAREKGVHLEAILVGDTAHGLEPGYVEEIQGLVRLHGLDRLVHLVGHQSDLLPYLFAADIVVNATERENLSLVLLEAASAGRAIVAVADGGSAESFDRECAVLLPTASPTLLALALQDLAIDPGLRARLGANARARYLQGGFTAPDMAQRLAAELRRVTRRV